MENIERTIMTGDGQSVVVIIWHDSDESPLQAIGRLNAEAMEAQRKLSQIEQPNLDGLQTALSLLDEAEGQANDAYDAAENAVQEAARARDYAAEAQSKIEDVKAEIGAVLNDD